MCSEDLGSFFIDLWDHLGGSLKTLFSFRLTRMFDYYFFDFFIVIEMRLGFFNFEEGDAVLYLVVHLSGRHEYEIGSQDSG